MTEIHFHSPSLGTYWVAIEDPSAEVRSAYPPDTIETSPRPSLDHQLQDDVWVHVPPPPPDLTAARARMTLSRRQLLIGLAAEGWITADEAVAAATSGVMPAAVTAVVATLPPAEQVAARITWAAMSVAQRLDPLVELLAVAQGVSAAQLDAFFVTYAVI